jgi:phosphatidylinositol glycan class T
MAEECGCSVDERWNSLQNSLGGLFCASISPKRDVSSSSSSRKKYISYPSLTYPPEGLLRSIPIHSSHHSNSSRSPSSPHRQTHHHHLRLSLLPSERLCTENLTPFLKLLPCTSRAGLASLLNPHALVSADWHGISVHFTQEQLGVRLGLEVRTVFDPVRTGGKGRAGEFLSDRSADWG